MLALMVMSNSESPNAGTTNAWSFAPLAISSPPALKLRCRPLTGSARSFGFRMLSLTAKFCCSRLPPRISTDTTDTVGRLNLGAMAEQAPKDSDSRIGNHGNMGEMIPVIRPLMIAAIPVTALALGVDAAGPLLLPAAPAVCLATGDGYLHAHLAGAIEANVDWPNSGT